MLSVLWLGAAVTSLFAQDAQGVRAILIAVIDTMIATLQ